MVWCQGGEACVEKGLLLSSRGFPQLVMGPRVAQKGTLMGFVINVLHSLGGGRGNPAIDSKLASVTFHTGA